MTVPEIVRIGYVELRIRALMVRSRPKNRAFTTVTIGRKEDVDVILSKRYSQKYLVVPFLLCRRKIANNSAFCCSI